MGNGSLTVSNIASIEEENAIEIKFGNKNLDKAVPFLCFSRETEQDTMIEIQGTSTVENTSLISAITIVSTVVEDYTDYQDHILSNEASEKISEKISFKSEQLGRFTQKTVKRKAPVVNSSESVGTEKL